MKGYTYSKRHPSGFGKPDRGMHILGLITPYAQQARNSKDLKRQRHLLRKINRALPRGTRN